MAEARAVAGILPPTQNVGADLRVVGLALSATIPTGIDFGLLPALTSAGLSPASMLLEGGSTGGKGQRLEACEGRFGLREHPR